MFPLLPQKISLQIEPDQGALVRQKHLIQTSCMKFPSQWRAMLQSLLETCLQSQRLRLQKL